MNLTQFKPQEVSTGNASTFIFKNDVVLIEPKIDGIRIILEKKGKEIKLYSRLMRDWTSHFSSIIPKLSEGIKYENCVIDGEIAVMKDKKFTSSNFVLKNKLENDEKYVYFAFDILEIGSDYLMDHDLVTRKNHLQYGINPNENLTLIPFAPIDNDEDLENIYRRILEKGMEGIVLKNLEPYGKLKFNWLKKKPFETLDLVITNKKLRKDNMGWIYELSDNNEKVGSTWAVADLKVGQVVEVKFEKKYIKGNSYRLRFPKIFRVRDDKV